MGDLGVVFERLGWKRSPPPPDPTLFSEECLSAGERVAEQVVNWVHPTRDSEERRKGVVDYLRRLIKSHFDCEVCPYGSVPLKTFLPDGDIDLTILKGPDAPETFPRDVLSLLQEEEHNIYSEYEVRDIKFIDAEVKLVKCLVHNIIIDISFNQLGGLSTLCFLEQVDHLVGKNHLFKRSIMLVKTWCYFESRILGAIHGLISTYAVEVLVLYIFHMFHSSLSGPLGVLYRFMEYYGQFDWENYCISLEGPVSKSLLPNMVSKMPELGWKDRMLSEEFLESCMDKFFVQPRGLDENPKAFQVKFMNIIDPLKENNNLGRSVHKGSFLRIRTALKYGARRLGLILLGSKDKIVDDLSEFFSVTLARHCYQHTFCTRNLSMEFGGDEEHCEEALCPEERFSEEDILLKSSDSDSDRDCAGASEMASEACYAARRCTSIYTSSSNYNTSHSWNQCQRFQPCSSSSQRVVSEKFDFCSCLENRKRTERMDNTSQWDMNDSRASSIAPTLEASIPDSESLVDLTGDYGSHVRDLLFGKLCNGSPCFAPVMHSLPYAPSVSNYRNHWDIVRESMPLKPNQFSQTNQCMVRMEHNMYRHADPTYPAFAFHSEGSQKARGTGTYFPIQSGFYRDMYSYSQGRGGSVTSGHHNQYHDTRYGSQTDVLHPVTYEYVTRAVGPTQGRSRGMGASSDGRSQTPHSHSVGDKKQTDPFSGGSLIEFGSVGNLGREVISGSPNTRGSNASAVTNQEKVPLEMIQLKNEKEFPSLCQSHSR